MVPHLHLKSLLHTIFNAPYTPFREEETTQRGCPCSQQGAALGFEPLPKQGLHLTHSPGSLSMGTGPGQIRCPESL